MKIKENLGSEEGDLYYLSFLALFQLLRLNRSVNKGSVGG